MRPFLAEFMIELLEKYHVFFYTAGIRVYGKLVVEIIKSHILAFLGDSDPRMAQIVETTCRDEHIIARDDKDRYKSAQQRTNENAGNAGAGGDSTIRLRNTFKSLKTLAGDNDSIFVILDDRIDVW